ncbi:MAG: sulfite exporter TauE/SafE family protein [Sedimenticola sp.]
MPELTYPTILLVLGILGFSGLVHGTLGLGFPMTATPLLALFTDVQTAILITLFPTIAVNILSIIRGGNWSESIGRYWPLALFAAIGSIIGTEVLIFSIPEPFKLLLALLILLYLNMHRIGRLKLGWIASHRNIAMAVFGLVAGFMAGTVNVMVPILVMFSLELGLAMTAMIQVFNLCFLAGKVSQVGVFSLQGMLGMDLLVSVLPGVVISIAALFLGMAIRDRIDTEVYRRVLRYLLMVSAVILIIQFSTDILS